MKYSYHSEHETYYVLMSIPELTCPLSTVTAQLWKSVGKQARGSTSKPLTLPGLASCSHKQLYKY